MNIIVLPGETNSSPGKTDSSPGGLIVSPDETIEPGDRFYKVEVLIFTKARVDFLKRMCGYEKRLFAAF